MKRKFLEYIEKHNLCTKNDKILVAVSGGVDSMVLLDLFNKNEFHVSVAHCNFNLREEESNRDENLVKSTCKKLGLEVFTRDFNTENYAKENGVSIQMAARDLRYNWFNELIDKFNFTKLSTAHHLNDNVETLLLNISRGTSIKGLKSIVNKKDILIRPLLNFDKESIIQYAKDEQISWRKDTSNESNKYKRNLIRNKVIPLFKEINPNFEERVSQNIEQFYEAEKIYQNYISKQKSELFINSKINIELLLKTVSPISVIWEIISEYGFTYSDAKQLLEVSSAVGKSFNSKSHRIIVDRKYIIIEAISNFKSQEIIINSIGEYKIPIGEISIFNTSELDKLLLKNKNFAFLNPGNIQFPLTLRKWQDGDKFKPFGMKNYQKISDYLINNKFSLFEKEKVYVLLSKNKIVWIVGERISNDFSIDLKNTKKFIQIEFKPH